MGLALVVLVLQCTQAQDSLLHQPFFYSLSPKIIAYQFQSDSPYDVSFEGEAYRFENNQSHTVNGMIPLVVNKKKWSAGLAYRFNYWTYDLAHNNERQKHEHLTHGYLFRLTKNYKAFNRQWSSTAVVLLEGDEWFDNKRTGFTFNTFSRLTIGENTMLLGGTFLFMKGSAVLFLPFLRYSTWLSKKHNILWDIKVPPFESSITKIVNNGCMLRLGLSLGRNFNFTTNEEFPFLLADQDYENYRLNTNCFLEAEKHLSHNIWLGLKVGYNYGVNNTLRKLDERPLESDFSDTSQYVFGALSMFYRLQHPPKKK